MKNKIFLSVMAAGAILLLAGCGGASGATATRSDTPAASATSVITTTTTAAPAPIPAATRAENGQLYDLQPQPYVAHPSMYLETGKWDPESGTDAPQKTWRIKLIPGTAAVVGGFTVDNVAGGVYKTYTSDFSVTVKDGFVSVVKSEWLKDEYDFRVGEAVKYSWAHAHLYPPTGSTQQAEQPTATSPAKPAAQVNSERQATGDGKTLNFKKGDTVIGVGIVLSDGTKFSSCMLKNAPSDGKVTTGVVAPWLEEQRAAKSCK